ncbi:MAG: response regulator [Alphaproteobacteria bacterium]
MKPRGRANGKPFVILIADDDPDDRMLVNDAFAETRPHIELGVVEDGEQLLGYLHRRGKFGRRTGRSDPDLILLDLNMPRKDGREALAEIKAHRNFRRIPVVILTTSRADEDILRTYDLGANSFITKPVMFESLINVVQVLADWVETVELPTTGIPVAA